MFSAEQTSILLVNYKNISDTLICLESLAGLLKPPQHILVVDNASESSSLTQLHQAWCALSSKHSLPQPEIINSDCVSLPTLALLPLQENTGFSGGNNAALSILLRTKCTGFWLLNNDTYVDPAALEQLCAVCNDTENIGICGSTVLFAASPQTIQCAGGGKLSCLTGRTRFLLGGCPRESIDRVTPRGIAQKLDWVSGCSFYLCRPTLEAIGLLPEKYFLYYEDVAYSRTAALHGFALTWAPGSVVYHKEGGSSGAKGKSKETRALCSETIDYLVIRNRFFLMRMLYPWSLPITMLSLFGIFWSRLRCGQSKRLRLLWGAALDGLVGKMGRPINFD